MANKVYILIIILLTAGIFAYIGWGESSSRQGIELQITPSPYTIQQSLERAKTALEAQNIPVTAEIAIADTDSNLPKAYLLLLNLPEAGELIAQNIETAGMLPIKIILWEDGPQSKLAFIKPELLAKHYNLDPQKTETIQLKLNKVTEDIIKQD